MGVSILRRVGDAEAALHPAHDRDVPVPSAVDIEIPARIQQQSNTRLAV